MSNSAVSRARRILAALAAVYFGLRYALGLVLPFLTGLLIALAAEPATALLSRRFRMKRGIAAFLGVTATLVLLGGLLLLLCSVLIRELGNLAGILPDIENTARQGLTSLQDWLLSLTLRAPEGIRSLLTKLVLGLYDSGGALYDQALSQLPGIATGMLSRLTGSALGIGTGILSAYLFSARLPRLKAWLQGKLPESWHSRYLPALKSMKDALLGWLKAQLRLMLVTFAIVCGGLVLLGIRYAPVWAALIALVDAVPMLGTGIALVPWSLISFLREDPVRGMGLLGIFAAATLTRSALEPRLVGRQLGLDPLVTLAALYLGYQLLGIPGMLIAPMLAVILIQAVRATPTDR